MVDLQNPFNSLKTAMVAKLAAKPAASAHADNSDMLNGKSLATVNAENTAAVATHASLNNNPHGVSLSAVNANSTSEISSMAATKLPYDQVPISYFGKLDGVTPPHSTNQFTLNMAAGIPVLLAGKYREMPAATFTLPNFSNCFLHVRLISGIPTYVLETLDEITVTRTPDSVTNMCVGVFQTNGAGIVREVVEEVRRIGAKQYLKYPYRHNKLMVVSSGALDFNAQFAGLYRNNVRLFLPSRGITLAYFLYGEPCNVDVFNTQDNPAENTRMKNFVDNCPAGGSVLVYTTDSYNNNLNQTGLDALAMLGIDSTILASKAAYRSAMLAFGKKGAAQGSVPVGYAGTGTSVIGSGDSNSSIVASFYQIDGTGFASIEIHKTGGTMINM